MLKPNPAEQRCALRLRSLIGARIAFNHGELIVCAMLAGALICQLVSSFIVLTH